MLHLSWCGPFGSRVPWAGLVSYLPLAREVEARLHGVGLRSAAELVAVANADVLMRDGYATRYDRRRSVY